MFKIAPQFFKLFKSPLIAPWGAISPPLKNPDLKQCNYNAKISFKVTVSFSKSDMSFSKVIKDTMLNSSVAFVVTDVRPLSAVEGDGLIQFANAIIKVGATHALLMQKQYFLPDSL